MIARTHSRFVGGFFAFPLGSKLFLEMTCAAAFLVLSVADPSDRAFQPFCVNILTGCFNLSQCGSVVDLSSELVVSDAAPSR